MALSWSHTLGRVAARWLALGALTSCDRPLSPPLCGHANTPELRALCAVDAVLVSEGAPADRLAACAEVEQTNWRDSCVLQVAEQIAWSGDIGQAQLACLDAPGITRSCLEQVSWQGTTRMVDASPSDAMAQTKIDALVEQLPDGGVVGSLRGFAGAGELVRAAAWHGVYAGSGSLDPTALRSAIPADLPLARTAFAWEAVRLLPADLPPEQVLAQVEQLLSGAVTHDGGQPLDERCWDVHIMPRANIDFRWQPVVRAHGSWARFYDADASYDLQIAVYDAIIMHRGSLPPPLVARLQSSPSYAMQKAAGRYTALLAPPQCEQSGSADIEALCAQGGWVSADGAEKKLLRDEVRAISRTVRSSIRFQLTPQLGAGQVCE